MEPNSLPANPAPVADAPQVDNYGFPLAGDLSTEGMSDAELDAFVDKTLGVKGTTNDVQPASPSAVPPNAQPETPTPPANSAEATPTSQAPEDKPAPELAPEEPAAIPELDTSDLWLEVKNTDGDPVRLTLEDGVPDDFLFANDKQLYEVLDAFQEMKQLKRQREGDIEKALADKATVEADQKTQQSTMDGWANEIQDLVDAGLIPKTDAAPTDGKMYTPAEVAANPGLKLTSEVFDYMKTENAKRATASKKPLTSFASAFTLYKNDAAIAATEAETKLKAEQVKQRGGMVGGTSAPASSDKGYVYKRGSARNIYQVDTTDI